MNSVYLDTARLLTQVTPLVFVDDTFALKGGTAINLFVRDMPRLSVDIDLVFPDHTRPRDQALARINAALRQAAERQQARISDLLMQPVFQVLRACHRLASSTADAKRSRSSTECARKWPASSSCSAAGVNPRAVAACSADNYRALTSISSASG